jgi:hypothetical protein
MMYADSEMVSPYSPTGQDETSRKSKCPLEGFSIIS